MPTRSLIKNSTRVRVQRDVSVNKFTGASSSSTTTTTGPNVVIQRKTMDWTNTVDFRTKVKQGKVLPDWPLVQLEVELKAGWIESVYVVNGNPNVVTTTVRESAFYYAVTDAGTTIPGLQTQLKMRLLEKMRDTEFNAPVAIAEAKSAIRMVADRALDLVQILRGLRRGDLTGLAKAAGLSQGKYNRIKREYNTTFGKSPSKAAANAWLESTYGWSPLIADCRNAVLTVMDAVDRDVDRVGSVRARVKGAYDAPVVNTTVGGHAFDRYRHVLETWMGSWRFIPRMGYYPARFGVLNPLTVAWEVLPFSFVADWFLPVGAYLASFDTPFRVDHSGGAYGQRWETDTVLNAVMPSNPGTQKSHTGLAVSRRVDLKRFPMTSAPDLSLSDLSIDPKLGSARMLSAISLLRQNLGFLSRKP